MAMLQCEIVTPEKVLFSGEATMVEAPSVGGSFGILPGHEAFSCLVMGGVAKVAQDAEHTQFQEIAITHGFAQVYDDKVTILVRNGCLVEDIDIQEVSAYYEALQQRYDAMTDGERESARSYSDMMQGGEAMTQPETTEGLAAKATANTILDDIEWCKIRIAARKK